jgi:splicing factor 3A subunit 3
MEDAKTHREKLYNEHIVDKFLTRIADKSEYLSQLYEDRDGYEYIYLFFYAIKNTNTFFNSLRQSEMEALSGSSEFTEFYERLKVLKEHHRKYPNETVEPPEMEFIHLSQKKEEADFEGKSHTFTTYKRDTNKNVLLELEKLFSGEESTGRYLDLNAIHTMYNNLKGCKKLDYLQYLSEFDDFVHVYPKNIKTSEDYKNYLNALHDYLYNFFRRSKPLFDINALEEEALLEFNKQWEQGEVAGWDVNTSNQDLFCAACQKQFSKQTVYDAHLTAKKHIKAQQKLDQHQQGNSSDGVVGAKDDKRKAIAWKERLVYKYAEALSDFREETKSNVERKQALTDKERTVSITNALCI